MIESIDKTVLIKEFKCLKSLMANKLLKNSLRFLCLFGFDGEEVIFATTDDEVYCYGRNRYGSLGLGVWNNHIPEPTLNSTLSGKGLVNVFDGFGDGVGNCIGLTADGLCYGWGFNDSGQLGIGNTNNINTPQMVEGMADKFVVQIGCGKRHALALDREGKVYAWGCNWFGQTSGKGSQDLIAIQVKIDDKIVSISCGKCHSLALSESGRVYVWGLNETGQLGRHKDYDQRQGARRAFCNVPQLVSGFESTSITKALCGPNHTIFLTNDGFIYTFGFNENGQIGNGCYDTQWTPHRVGEDMTFKDFVVNYDSDLTIGVTTDGKPFAWGFNYYCTRICNPYEITDYKTKYNLLDLYAHFSPVPKVYESLIFDANKKWLQNYKPCDRKKSVVCNELIAEPNLRLPSRPVFHSVKESNDSSVKTSNGPSNALSKPSPRPSNEGITPGSLFLKHLSKSFDNPNDYDLRFEINGRSIYCHKTVVRIRNKEFWKKCEQNLDKENKCLIKIKTYSYEAFYAFIQWLYGTTPEINDQNSRQLSQLADIYFEPDLQSLCPQLDDNVIDLQNVCTLYKMAINDNLTDLKNSCVEFAKSNWKAICKTQEFEDMNEDICKQLIISVMN